METFRIFASRVAALFRSRRLDSDLADEISNHIELATEENMLLGMNRSQARTAALRHFGGPTQIQETYRQQRGFPLLDQATQDLRFAWRQLYRAPGFAATAILTLALGLGANTAVFSLINGLLLRPLPVPHAERLAVLMNRWANDREAEEMFSGPLFRSLEKRHELFENVAAYYGATFEIHGAGNNVDVPGVLVSGQYFNALQVAPELGRTLTAQDDAKGSPNGFAVVISDGFWKSWFHGSLQVIGSQLVVGKTPFTVVGVMPRTFFGAEVDNRPSIYAPLASEPVIHAPFSMLASDGIMWIRILGRLKEGATMVQANAALAAVTDSLLGESITEASFLKTLRTNHFQIFAVPGVRGSSYLRTAFQRPLVIVFVLCGGMLLLACLNLASLLMARATARERELATRLAIGATRRRLIHQLMVESLVIAALGTAAGLAVTPLASRALAALLLSGRRNTYVDTSIDLRVFCFAAIATFFAAAVIGLMPALRATSSELNEQIKSGSQNRTIRRGRRTLPRVLMGAEVAIALMLVIGAGLLAVSLTRLYRTGLGFEPKGLVQLELNMRKHPLPTGEHIRWYEQFGAELMQQPGIHAVSFTEYTPFNGNLEKYEFKTPWTQSKQALAIHLVAPGYFSTLRIPMAAGRDFAWRGAVSKDGKDIILNESAARILFPNRNPLGQTITPCADDERSCRVIAVVGDTRNASIREEAKPEVYLSIVQSNRENASYTAVIRIDGAAGQMVPAMDAARRVCSRIAPDAPAPEIMSLNSILDTSLTSERMMAMLSVFFAGCALLVTGIGLYGTLAYTTIRRTSEIGVRMALGAQRLQVVMLVFRENLWSTSMGALAGLGIALAGARVLTGFLYGTSVHDPWVLTGAVTALALIASTASLLPAVRAARIEPMEALRAE